MGNKVILLLVTLGFTACTNETPNAVQHFSEPSQEVKESMETSKPSCDPVNTTTC